MTDDEFFRFLTRTSFPVLLQKFLCEFRAFSNETRDEETKKFFAGHGWTLEEFNKALAKNAKERVDELKRAEKYNEVVQ